MSKVNPKYANPLIRTVGQLNCCGYANPTTTFGLQNIPGGDPAAPRRMANEEDTVRSQVHRTFSRSPSPRGFPEAGDNTFVKFVPETEFATSQTAGQSSVNRKTSEMGVQANMFHCKECRTHIKLGKELKNENCCTESDSETNLVTSHDCNVNEESNTLSSHVESIRECNCPCNKHSLRTDRTLKDNEDNVQARISSQNLSRISLSSFRSITVAVLILCVIVSLTQIQPFGAMMSKICFYVRNTIVRHEDEKTPSIFDWFLNELFGVLREPKLQTLFLYWLEK